MKKLFVFVSVLYSVLLMCTGCNGKQEATSQELGPTTFVIEGKMPAELFDSACLYLVPMQGPHPRPVDSVFVNRDGSFRFVGNVEQMAVLRLDWHYRLAIRPVEDLLVVTEPGTLHVNLDSISSGYGTPQNDSLQTIKERLVVFRQEYGQLIQMRNQKTIDSVQYALSREKLTSDMGNWNYRLCKNLGSTTLTRFLYHQMFSGQIDEAKRAELDVLLNDTIDYTKPQPGFRK